MAGNPNSSFTHCGKKVSGNGRQAKNRPEATQKCLFVKSFFSGLIYLAHKTRRRWPKPSKATNNEV